MSRSRSGAPRVFAEFFAGIGLMRMGLERAGWSARFANDLDPQKEAMYKANFPSQDAEFAMCDIHRLPARRVPDVTLATASFPCNDLSLAGKRSGLEGTNSSAFWGFIAILKGLGRRRPPLVLIENVPGFLTSHNGQDFRKAMLALNDLGYGVDPFVVDASWFVPQSRRRLFVAAELAPNARRSVGTIACEESALRPAKLAGFINDHPDIYWRIRPLPDPPSCKRSLAELIEELPSDSPEWWSRERADYLLSQMSARHRQVAETMIMRRQISCGTVFRRVRNGVTMAELRTDGVAGCLRTPRGGSGRQILLVAGKGGCRVRLLTPRECARLMGAEDFRITVPSNQALFGFGDAVCVPAIEWIARHRLNPEVQ